MHPAAPAPDRPHLFFEIDSDPEFILVGSAFARDGSSRDAESGAVRCLLVFTARL